MPDAIAPLSWGRTSGLSCLGQSRRFASTERLLAHELRALDPVRVMLAYRGTSGLGRSATTA
jgi:hypothetical protein